MISTCTQAKANKHTAQLIHSQRASRSVFFQSDQCIVYVRFVWCWGRSGLGRCGVKAIVDRLQSDRLDLHFLHVQCGQPTQNTAQFGFRFDPHPVTASWKTSTSPASSAGTLGVPPCM